MELAEDTYFAISLRKYDTTKHCVLSHYLFDYDSYFAKNLEIYYKFNHTKYIVPVKYFYLGKFVCVTYVFFCVFCMNFMLRNCENKNKLVFLGFDLLKERGKRRGWMGRIRIL